MALIKCSECGKEISDKASACMNCGCPINSNKDKETIAKNQSTGRKEIIKSKRELSLNNFKGFYTKILGVVIVIATIVILGMEMSLPPYSNSRGNAFIFGAILVYLPCVVLFIVCNIMYKNAIKTNITLTNKELSGVIYKIGSVSSISFPLDKISSINTIRWLGVVDGIIIIPVNGISQKVLFIDNGEEFRQAILNQVVDK